METILQLFNTNLTYVEQQQVWYTFFKQTLPEWLFIGFVAILGYFSLCNLLRNKLVFKRLVAVVFLILILLIEGIQHFFRS